MSVYYLLVDSKGRAYKGAQLEVLDLPRTARVSQFQNSVKKEDVDMLLQNIRAADLQVYDNKTAWENNQGPLGRLEPLNDLGRTEDVPIYVVAPPPFPRCQIPFYNEICNARLVTVTVNNGMLLGDTEVVPKVFLNFTVGISLPPPKLKFNRLTEESLSESMSTSTSTALPVSTKQRTIQEAAPDDADSATAVPAPVPASSPAETTPMDRLYVRESYVKIADNILSDTNTTTNQESMSMSMIKKAIVNGTPGIGKSWFLLYLLWKLVSEKRRVLFIYQPHTIYFDGERMFDLENVPITSLGNQVWTSDLWCLFDARNKDETKLGEIHYADCSVVVSMSSPSRRELVNDFKKPTPVPATFYYMPLWSEEELSTISSWFSNAPRVWRDRFEKLGGVPRYVLEDVSQKPEEIIYRASSDLEFWESVKRIGKDSVINARSNIIHSLIHMTSVSPHTESSVDFASEAAYNAIMRAKTSNQVVQLVKDLVNDCTGNPIVSVLCGRLFETHVIRLLEAGGTFKCRKLSGPAASTTDDTSIPTITIAASEKITVQEVESTQAQNTLFVPNSRTYPAIDAWIPGTGAFQISVAASHDIKDNQRVTKALEALGHKFYWVLPEQLYESGKFDIKISKTLKAKLHQYAVCIPLPPAISKLFNKYMIQTDPDFQLNTDLEVVDEETGSNDEENDDATKHVETKRRGRKRAAEENNSASEKDSDAEKPTTRKKKSANKKDSHIEAAIQNPRQTNRKKSNSKVAEVARRSSRHSSAQISAKPGKPPRKRSPQRKSRKGT